MIVRTLELEFRVRNSFSLRKSSQTNFILEKDKIYQKMQKLAKSTKIKRRK
ncbi:Uncharacterised protein [uncultured Clostridium sp.]|nr:Uncharacterised protein [uncultured Clostridium sp.]